MKRTLFRSLLLTAILAIFRLTASAEPHSGYCVESVESYIARNLHSVSTGKLNRAIMKFAVSAYEYLGGTT